MRDSVAGAIVLTGPAYRQSPIRPRRQLQNVKIAIVHYGEDVPTDAGYRPLRYGQFARRWTLADHEVTRISPSFSHLRRRQRNADGHSESVEGSIRIVATPGYDNSRGWRRGWFLVVWVVRSAAEMRRMRHEVDCFLIGHPPPGTLALFRLLGGRTPVVVDIRDTWFGGSVLSRMIALPARLELRLASGETALSREVAAWTGDAHRPVLTPIGVDSFDIDPDTAEGPLRCVFVGSLNDRFMLTDWITAWPDDGAAHLDIFGAGPSADDIAAAASERANVTYRGWLEPESVPSVLAEYDVGIAPTIPGFGTNISNKVAEYLAAGLLVVHSLNDEPSAVLDNHHLGRRASTADMEAVIRAASRSTQTIRSTRGQRQQAAIGLLGWDAIADSLLETLMEVS